MPVLDQKQHDTAEWLVTESLKSDPGPSAIINLAGAVGSGKTSVLRTAEQMLRQRRDTLFLSAPQAGADTSAIVLADAADSLVKAGSLNGQGDILRDPERRWIDKFRAVTEVIDGEPDRYVVLCDEPLRWFRRNESEVPGTHHYQTRVISDWLFTQTCCRRVVTGGLPATGLPFLKRDKAPRIDDGRELLTDGEFWAGASDLAASVASSTKRSIEDRSVMEIRLLVAWAWLFNPKNAAQQCARQFSTTSMLEGLLDRLEASALTNQVHQAVCQAMARLAVARTSLARPAAEDMLHGVTALESDVIRGCFCEEFPETIALHPLVAHEVLMRARDRKREEKSTVWRLVPAERTQVHNRLYDLVNQTPAGTSFRADLESLHHGVLSNQIQQIGEESRLHFVEQLHEIGRSLSYVFRNHQKAAEVFRLALNLDSDNAYSHHYLAFNLDWDAKAAEEVETHYRKAIELQPEHPWWWSRWISYLATRGRFKAAGNQWREALDALSVTEDATPGWVYMSLHRWVARWMLHWSNLDLAENVLRSIPSSLKDDASIARLNDLLVAMRYAEKDRAVFPLSVPASQWWTPRPNTNLPNEAANLRLSHWYPARVQQVDESGVVFLLYAEPPTRPDAEPIFRNKDLSPDEVQAVSHEFNSECLHEGSFIELGYYGENAVLKIGLHAEGPLNDPDLIPLVPPPDRWYDRAVAASWDEVGGDQ